MRFERKTTNSQSQLLFQQDPSRLIFENKNSTTFKKDYNLINYNEAHIITIIH